MEHAHTHRHIYTGACTHTHTHTQIHLSDEPISSNWSTNLKNFQQEPFSSHVGPTASIPESPSEIFSLFFTPTIMSNIVEESNKYAKQMMGEEKYAKWTPITERELKAYFGFCILMGIVSLPSLDDYWKKDPLLNYSPISSRISRDRFRDIRRYIHFNDNDQIPAAGTPGRDRLAKIRRLLEALTKRCLDLYDPHKNVAVDEAMIKFQGRSTIKQYMPKKCVKRGIKVWVLGDSENGYASNLQVYTGKEESAKKGLGSRVVKDLTRHLKDKHHHVFFANFFTSVQLLEDLEKEGTYACGTARADRKRFPESLKKVKSETIVHAVAPVVDQAPPGHSH